MKSWTKRLLKFAGIVLLLGLLIAVIGFAASGFTLGDLTSNVYKTNHVYYSTDTQINKISLNFHTTDVSVEYSSDAQGITITYETKHKKSGEAITSVIEKNENGIISLVEKKEWYAGLNLFDFYSTKASITLPENYSVALEIETDTGNISVNGATGENRVELSTDTGNVRVENSEFSAINIETDTGDIRALNMKVNEALRVETDTGDVTLKSADAKSVSINTDSGDVDLRGVNAVENIVLELDTGDVQIEESLTASALLIETDTGDVDGEDATVNANNVTIDTSTGDVELNLAGSKSEYWIEIQTRSGQANVSGSRGGPRTLKFTSRTGDCEVYFAS